MKHPDVVIAGGGITGVTAALALAEAGAKVKLVERRRLAAMGSGWTLGGVRQSGRDPAELPLALAAIDSWRTLDARLGGKLGYRRCGNLRLARTEAEVPVIRALVETQRAAGLAIEYLPDNAAVRAVAPGLSRDILAASFCPGDGHADPEPAVRALAEEARRLGVEIVEGCGATGLLTAGGRARGLSTERGDIEADVTVLATGLETPRLLTATDMSLPLLLKIVLVVQSTPVAPVFGHVFGVANADCAGRQEIDGRLRYTTGISDWPSLPADWTQDMLQPRARDVAMLIERAGAVLPAILDAGVSRVWGGLIDLTPDGLPVLDVAMDGLVVAAGFSGHGFGIGPVSGEIVADLVLNRSSRFDLSPFRAARFADYSGEQAPLTLHG